MDKDVKKSINRESEEAAGVGDMIMKKGWGVLNTSKETISRKLGSRPLPFYYKPDDETTP